MKFSEYRLAPPGRCPRARSGPYTRHYRRFAMLPAMTRKLTFRWIATTLAVAYVCALGAACPPASLTSDPHHHDQMTSAEPENEPIVRVPCGCGCGNPPRSVANQPSGLQPAEAEPSVAFAQFRLAIAMPWISDAPVYEIDPIPI